MTTVADSPQSQTPEPRSAPGGQSGAGALGALRTVEFRLSLKGYNVDEVDQYLEQVATEVDSLAARCQALDSENQRLRVRVTELEVAVTTQTAGGDGSNVADPGTTGVAADPAQPTGQVAGPVASPAVADDTLQRTLLLAQQFVDEAKRRSEEEASELVARARAEADRLISLGRAEAEALQAETARRRQAELGALEADRDRLVEARDQLAARLDADIQLIRERLLQALSHVDEGARLGAVSPQPADASGSAADPGDGAGRAPDPTVAPGVSSFGPSWPHQG